MADIDKLDGLDEARQPLAQARHAPGYFYNSPEVYRLEKENIFLKEWLCVGRVEEVENPGDYMTFDIAGEPIIISRDAKGALHALANCCAHRGVEVVRGSGNADHFSCPYHGWAYELDGRLQGAPFMKEADGFDPETCGLTPLRLETWVGWIFVTFNPDPPALSEKVAEFERDFGLLKMEDCRLADKITLDLDCNWKLVVENLMDVYHSQVVHAKSFGKNRSSPEKYPLETRADGGTCTFYEASPMTPDGNTLFKKMPWLEDRPENFACSGHLSPNMQVIARCDNVHPLVMWPVTAETSRTFIYIMYPNEFFDWPDFDAKRKVYVDFMNLALGEDRDMVSALQRAMGTHVYRPGRMSVLERLIHHVINDNADRIYSDRN